MGYRKSDLWKIEDLPVAVASSQDLQMQIYSPKVAKSPAPDPEPEKDFGQDMHYNLTELKADIPVEHILVYSIELQSFWIKLNRPEIAEWTEIQKYQLLDADSTILQIDYTLGKELVAFIFYQPQLKSVIGRLFKIKAAAQPTDPSLLICRGEITLDTDVEQISEVDKYMQLNPLLIFSKNKVRETDSYCFVSSTLPYP